LDASSSRCETPNLCCSSMTARPSFHEHAVPCSALFATCQDRNPHADAVELLEQGRMVLPRQDFGRRQQGRLRA
jgi:hypothetical protein